MRSFKRDADERQTDRPPFFDRGPDSPAVTQASPPMSFSPSRLPHHRSHLKTNLRAPEKSGRRVEGSNHATGLSKGGLAKVQTKTCSSKLRGAVKRYEGCTGAGPTGGVCPAVKPCDHSTVNQRRTPSATDLSLTRFSSEHPHRQYAATSLGSPLVRFSYSRALRY